VEAKTLMQISEKFCEVCALKFASFSLSQNRSALFVGPAITFTITFGAPPKFHCVFCFACLRA